MLLGRTFLHAAKGTGLLDGSSGGGRGGGWDEEEEGEEEEAKARAGRINRQREI